MKNSDNENIKVKKKSNKWYTNPNVIRNIFSAIFILGGFAGFTQGEIIPGFIYAVFGVSLTTLIDKPLMQTQFNKVWHRIVLCTVLFGLTMAVTPKTEDSTVLANGSSSTPTVEVEVAPTPTINPNTTATPTPKSTTKPISTSAVEATGKPTSEPNNTIQNKNDSSANNVVSTTLSVEACNLSGSRSANAIVDVGYGDREYYAYTNEYGQVVKVTAAQIILQTADEANSDGRYCSDEAKVPGVEASNLDEGHIIADSLGGVSNAYNITPMDSQLNRYGAQADMEDEIRDAGGATNFEAIITYPNTETMVPSRYKYTYTINGYTTTVEFENTGDGSTSSSSTSNNGVNSSSNNNSGSNASSQGSTSKSQEQIDCENSWGVWKDGSWCDWGSNNQTTESTPSKSQEQIDCENSWGIWRDGSWCDWGTSTSDQTTQMVWIPETGDKYHSYNSCGRTNPDNARQVSLADAQAMGYGPCSKCW